MKNVILTLAFMLMGTFAFANGEEQSLDKDIITTNVVSDLTTTFIVNIVDEQGTCRIHHYVYRPDGSLMGSFVITAPDNHPDCNGVVFHMT